jgi:hypothetical protein
MSTIYTLTRDTRETYCTLGILEINGHRLHTIERPWIPNPDGGKGGKRFESCVAEGTYRLDVHRSEKFGQVWALVNPLIDVYHWPADVPRGREPQARVCILIHAANFAHEVLGCIAPGLHRGKVGNEWMVGESRDALNRIKTVLGNRLDVRVDVRWAEAIRPTKEAA